MNALIDERRGLPSASEYPRIFHCSGYLALKATLKVAAREDPPAWTKSGQRIAAALEGQLKVDALTDDEQTTFHLIAAGRRAIMSATFGEDANWTVYQETRLWLEANGDQKIFSGKFDFAAVTATQFVIIDDKTGHLEVLKADRNLQLRALAVLVARNLKLQSGFVAVNQPWFRPPYSLAFYGSKELEQAAAELVYALDRTKDADAPRVAGEWCKYCPCLTACEEARAHSLKIGRKNPAAVTTSEALGEFLAECYPAEDVIRAVKDEVKRRLIAHEEVPGWRLKPGDVRIFVSDPQRVFERAADLGISRDAFMAAVQIDKARLREVIKAATKRRGAELDRTVDEILRDCIDEKTYGPSLERAR